MVAALCTLAATAALAVAAPSAGAAPAAPAAPPAPVAAKKATTVDPKLAPTPPMGFNDWNAFGCNVDEALIEQTADYFVSSGLKAAGYKYVDIDDCWLLKDRSATGHLVPDPAKFPDGITGTAAYVHKLGLKLGIYEDAGTKTCAGYPGSLGHEQTDADDFASWGVDLLKYDNCNNNSDGSLTDYESRYHAMSTALAGSGRKILLSLCEWGVNNPGSWAGQYGSMWRTTNDISDNWTSLKSIIAQNAPLAQYAGPGGWNDPDMLEVGNGGMTDTEYKTHFSMWAEMAAPLIIGTDLRKASAETLAILKNKAVIAVDQDKLGVQGQVIAQNSDGSMVLSKPLSNGDRAIALYNASDTARSLSTTAARAGLPRSTQYKVKDLWTNASTETAGTVAATVPAHGTVLVRVTPVTSSTLAPLTALAVSTDQADPSLPAVTSAGGDLALTTTATDYGPEKLTGVRVTADAPDGWSVSADDKAAKASLGTNATLTTHWTVTAPASVAAGSYQVLVALRYGYGKNRSAVQEQRVSVQIASPPPAGADPVSDLTWSAMSNYWGPVEKDQSNGEQAAGDGKPITIAGTVFAKGLGTNAPSTVLYYLGGRCTSLTSKVGLDDEIGSGVSNGVIFQVYADGTKKADSGVVTKATGVASVSADVTGATWLQLVVDDNGDTNYDHADWASPVLTCTS